MLYGDVSIHYCVLLFLGGGIFCFCFFSTADKQRVERGVTEPKVTEHVCELVDSEVLQQEKRLHLGKHALNQ
jgi:hypothetical protein